MANLPAILGGRPIFDTPLPISQPTMPPFDLLVEKYREVFRSGQITNGKYVQAFEDRVAASVGVSHAVAVSSNTTGMLLVFKCLGLRGEVILPSFTFFVTGHVLAWNNLTPVYVDIDPETCLLDPAEVERAITPKTCAIFAVHIWGNPCAADRLQALADRHALALVFDAAQAMGSSYQGRPVGGFGDVEVFSCSPTKLLTSGEGGIVTTNDPRLAERVRMGRNYGHDGSYDCSFEGINARMSELHAILGLASLELLKENLEGRHRLAERYKERLGKIPGITFPMVTPGGRSNHIYFPIILDPDGFGLTRDQLHHALHAENIETRCYYDPPLHRQSVNADLLPRYEGRLPHTDRMAKNSLTLPLFSHMTGEALDGVCIAIERLFEYQKVLREKLPSPRRGEGR